MYDLQVSCISVKCNSSLITPQDVSSLLSHQEVCSSPKEGFERAGEAVTIMLAPADSIHKRMAFPLRSCPGTSCLSTTSLLIPDAKLEYPGRHFIKEEKYAN
ncbi:hypothetical protein Pmani_028962 [Petrolisthes manimaculis]|uniref:Uncharacterized protein n=1 Tax=Petrolisthes manimaculis TaxID=1843537 RepID=A0AAE1P0D1_9EUCA|nr:hypothetical protein Pmani_028962 [Petrolisthes manimaculis]